MKLKHKGEETQEVSQRILAYLIDNPDAHYTLKGIADWWLLQQSTESIKVAQNLSAHFRNMKVIANQIEGDKNVLDTCSSFLGSVGTRIGHKNSATEAGQQVGEKAGGVGEKIEDAGISLAIQMKFANDKFVSVLNINVGTVDGHVTLNGIAASQTEISRAVKLGQSVDGVKSVHSNLVIPSRN